jgi:hypothetical protein
MGARWSPVEIEIEVAVAVAFEVAVAVEVEVGVEPSPSPPAGERAGGEGATLRSSRAAARSVPPRRGRTLSRLHTVAVAVEVEVAFEVAGG